MPVLDPDARKLLEIIRAAGKPGFEQLTPEQARAAYAASWDFLQSPAQEVASVLDLSIDGPAGPLAVRVYRGAGTAADEPLPCLLFLHGGGFVIGTLDSHDRLCRRLANGGRICVVAVDYRLAPEHPYPAGLEDALAVWRWLAAPGCPLPIARDRLAIGGDSAGAAFAAVIALMGRDGTAPRAMYQALIYPVVDLTCGSDSYRRVTSGVPTTASTMYWFIDHYAPPGTDRSDWRLSPLKAGTLAGTPPALVVTVGADPLCDEGRAYARRLEEDGVRVTALHRSDQLHGFLMQGRHIAAADATTDMIGLALRIALRQDPAQV